ncbi:MAG: DNA-binding protein [Prevotellaceae bacterium]|jgi:predicted histone-like DNA-binding protein|nr:DNA-binding protein [Prevotellaceae bacterium]
MKYKLIWRENPRDRSQKKLYATPVNDGTVTESDLKKEIVALSLLSKGDVSNVIECVIDVVPKYLLMGKSVKLGDIETLRMSLSSKGVDSREEFNAGMINGERIIFTRAEKAAERHSF